MPRALSFPALFLRVLIILSIVAGLLPAAARAQSAVNFTPTTTLAAETGNNASASPAFGAQSNGNAAGSSNVSKLPIRNLLYAGSTTSIYAHLQVWFGGSNHMNVGYSSSDAAQVHRQAQDMISRGISGAIVDWYGQNFVNENNAALAVKAEAGTEAGQWNFALLYDSGALNACASTSGCSVTQQLISDLQYAYQNYFNAPGYIRYSGQPVVFLFGVDQFAIDWNAVRSYVPGDPLYLFEFTGSTSSGFAHAQANGAFSWQSVNGTTSTDTGLAYLDSFYSSALSNSLMLPYGSAYKGFNDSLAPWAPNPARVMTQGCGQTWLSSLAESGKYYSSANQLSNLQIVTWNDYEEGSEIETGIDNCVSVSASVSMGALSWTVAGNESTVDHYTVFISQNGQNLMPLTDVPTGTHSLNLSQYNFGSTTYTFFVKAVGKPSLLNHMSNGVAWNQTDKPPVVQLTVSPTSGSAPLTVNASTSGSSDPDGTIASSSINFGDGTVVSGTSASHVYGNAGSFVVTGTVTDNLGVSSSTQTTVTVSASSTAGPSAVLSASPASGVAPLSVSASLSGSTDPSGNITQYTFNWGDGTANSSGPSASATHVYNTAGNYTLTGTVTDNHGKTSSATKGISVTTSGVTITSPANGATVTSPVHVVASASAPNQPITAMTVYVDNVSTYTAYTNTINTNITMSIGSHHVVINAWDGGGNVYQSGVTITVSSQVQDTPPVAVLNVTPTSGQAPLVVSASTSGSYDPDGTVTSTTINWGDGSLVTGPNANHTYQTGGTYTVTATAYDNNNLTGTASAVVTVGGNSAPFGSLDGATVSNGSLSVVGWAADQEDGSPVKQVQVFVDGFLSGNATLGGSRPDVASGLNNQRYANSGWTFTRSVSGLSPGQHTATAIAYDSGNATGTIGPARTFSVVNTPPTGYVDQAINAANGSTTVPQSAMLYVSGWAADQEDKAPIARVQVRIDGTVVGNATLGGSRPDIATLYGSSAYTNAGWSFSYNIGSLATGNHTVSAVGYDSVGAATTLNNTPTISVVAASNTPPTGYLDQAINAANGSTTVPQSGMLYVSGWAADQEDKAPIARVQVRIDGTVVGNATLGGSRPDIATLYGSSAYTNAGWSFSYNIGSLATGNHTVSAVGYDSAGAATTLTNTPTISVVAATSSNTPPTGYLDQAVNQADGTSTIPQSGTLYVSGWAADQEDKAPVTKVEIRIDGTVVGNATLGGSRPDIATLFGSSAYTNAGWTLSYNIGSLATGSHTVSAVAYDSLGATTVLTNTPSITVSP